MSVKDSILVVIPYLSSAAQGRELELSVAGWRKHFKEKFLIVVVGDWHPVVESGKDITFIKCPRVGRVPQPEYRPHIDHVNKFLAVRNAFPKSKGFIYACDDMYAIKDFTLATVKKPKVRMTEILGSFHSENAWVRENYRTKKLLMKEGLPTMNWVCHLPVYYEWDKLLEIYEKYSCREHSRVVEQLYFNTYFADSDYDVLEDGSTDNEYQAKYWNRADSGHKLDDYIGKKYWICNSERGWTKELEDALVEYYGL